MRWGSNLIKRKPSREEVERRKAAQISPEYVALAEKAAKRMTDDYVRRWKRIKSDPVAQAFFEEAMRLSERIPNAQVAVDIFEHVASLRRPQVLRPASDPVRMIPKAILSCWCSSTKRGRANFLGRPERGVKPTWRATLIALIPSGGEQ
jgi:hypothetical protein